MFGRSYERAFPFRRLGSAAIDLAGLPAAGSMAFMTKLEAWDSAAGYLIVEEAA